MSSRPRHHGRNVQAEDVQDYLDNVLSPGSPGSSNTAPEHKPLGCRAMRSLRTLNLGPDALRAQPQDFPELPQSPR